MHKSIGACCLLLIHCAPGQGTQTRSQVRLRIQASLEYEEAGRFCTNAGDETGFLLEGKLDDDKLFHASLQQITTELIPAKLTLLPEEADWMRVRADDQGAIWIRDYPLSGRLIQWFLHNASAHGACRPSVTLRTLTPASYPFTFDWPDRPSSSGSFQGVLYDGKPYRARLHFTQRPVD